MATDEVDPLAQKLVDVLVKKKAWITTAESCTGGLVAVELTAVAGTSKVFDRSFITYSNEAKQKLLGVRASTLKSHGAVSKEVAAEMAEGARKKAKADIAIAITGIAGPTGGTKEKPVGLVFIAVSDAKRTQVARHQFKGSRKEIREQSMRAALKLAITILKA